MFIALSFSCIWSGSIFICESSWTSLKGFGIFNFMQIFVFCTVLFSGNCCRVNLLPQVVDSLNDHSKTFLHQIFLKFSQWTFMILLDSLIYLGYIMIIWVRDNQHWSQILWSSHRLIPNLVTQSCQLDVNPTRLEETLQKTWCLDNP